MASGIGVQSSEEATQTFGDYKATGNCPGLLKVGVSHLVRFRIENTGSEDSPVTFVSFFSGLDLPLC